MANYNREANTQYAREWRRTARLALIVAMGGRCTACWYSRCASALDFHHVNQEDKEYEIGKLMAQRAWNKMKREAQKCILLCCRCHREHHAGELKAIDTTLPTYAFLESLSVPGRRQGGVYRECPVSPDELRTLRSKYNLDNLATILSANKRTVMRWCKEIT